jgi:predicted PurR-regulated permease PerM
VTGGGERDLGAAAGGRLDFARRAFASACAAASVVAILLVSWYAADVLMLLFAAMLLAVGLRSLSEAVGGATGLPGGWSLALVALALLALLAAGTLLLAPRVSAQVDELSESLPRAFELLAGWASRHEWARRLVAELPPPEELIKERGGVLARVTGVFSTALGALVNAVIVAAVGLYLAADPRLYTSGLMSLVPPAGRRRAREVSAQLGSTLRRWLAGRLVLMAANAALTWVGLSLLGAPLALTLGLLAGLLNFVPNVGPFVAGVPAVLLALTQSPQQAVYVLVLYVVLQSADGYVFTPLVQRRTVALPPALTIAAQVLLGVLLGGAGVALATPLTAAALVLVRTLYVEDVLGGGAAAEGGRAHAG